MSNLVTTSELAELRIQLLDAFCVWVGPKAVTAEQWQLRKAQSLVKLLALAPEHRLHREQVMDLLWPDSDPDSAANSLHQALHAARQALDVAHPKRYLSFQGETLYLCPESPLWVDVEAFESGAAEAHRSREIAHYRTAAALYGGDLLPEDRYDEWAAQPRESLRQTYVHLLLELARLAELGQDYALALDAFEQVLAKDPAHEEAQVGLMRVYALTGRRQSALRQYLALQETLQRELGADPDPQSRQLYQDILAGRFPLPEMGSASQPGPPSGLTKRSGVVQGTRSHNLPIQLTRFIGREREKAEVRRLLAGTRLLTLIGPGGCGKTRLALEVAGELSAEYTDGIWLVELADLFDHERLPHQVASALGIWETSGQPLLETLQMYLKSRQLLLVLDNCEHLIESCARLAEALLRSCAGLRILATSREPVRISGELTWLVPSLSLADPRSLPAPEDLIQSEAARLFLDRALAAQPDFAITPDNVAAVAAICYRLDGMPLAVELAAAQVRVLAVEQIAARLEDSLNLLRGGSRTALTRQQTLAGAMDWSHNLLSERERVLFRGLAVFAGGFDLEAAEAICASGEIQAHEVLDVLTNLVDKSLVTARPRGRTTRYRLLEPIRLYARDRLEKAGEAVLLRDRHADWYLGYAERAEAELWGHDHTIWLDRLETEHDNLRTALAWWLEHDAQAGLRLANSLWQFWLVRGYLVEGRDWLKLMLEVIPDRTALRARALQSGFAINVRFGDNLTAVALIQESLAISLELRDQAEACRAYQILGALALLLGDVASSKSSFEASLAAAQEAGFRAGRSMATYCLGALADAEGDIRRARQLMEDSLAQLEAIEEQAEISDLFLNIAWTDYRRAGGGRTMAAEPETILSFRRVDTRSANGYILANMGTQAHLEGDYQQARTLLEKSLARFQALADAAGVGQVLGQLGNLAWSVGDHRRARAFLEESLSLRRRIGDRRGIGRTLGNLGNLSISEGDYRAAKAYLDEGLDLFQEMGDKPGMAAMLTHLGNLAMADGDYGRAASMFEQGLNKFRELGAKRPMAVSLFNLGMAAELDQDVGLARKQLEESLALFEAIGDRRGAVVARGEVERLTSP